MISKLKNKNTVGCDGISSTVIKFCAASIAKPLMYIMNMVFLSGIFPDALNRAVVVPICKAGTRCEVVNYRPISLLPCCHVDRRRNIDQAVFRTFHEVLEGFNGGDFSAIALLDLSTAFDSLDIDLLIHKLEHMVDIRGLP